MQFVEPNHGVKYTEADMQKMLRAKDNGANVFDLSRLMGRSPTAIAEKLRKTGFSSCGVNAQWKHWSEEDVSTVKRLWSELYTVKEISKITRRSPGSILGARSNILKGIPRNGMVQEAQLWFTAFAKGADLDAKIVAKVLGVGTSRVYMLRTILKDSGREALLRKLSTHDVRGVPRLVERYARLLETGSAEL